MTIENRIEKNTKQRQQRPVEEDPPSRRVLMQEKQHRIICTTTHYFVRMDKLLVSWIGHTDLKAMARESSDSLRTKVVDLTGGEWKAIDGTGPVKTAVTCGDFAGVYLLSNYPAAISKAFVKWLGKKAEIIPCRVDNPADYSQVYNATTDALKTVSGQARSAVYCMLLSPGTPAMAAVLLLLGKTKYPAIFYQTHRGSLRETDVPFDITVDVLGPMYEGADDTLNQLTRLSPQETPGFEQIVGNSKVIRMAVGRSQRAAMRDVTVLLSGESGTGKELFARAIHSSSRRREAPFVPVNCAAIPKELLESELFGHVKGAFTGANKDYAGAFKRADGGVLFLDEVGECSHEIQAKLLRAMQPLDGQHGCVREVLPVGSQTALTVDVRVVAATNRDLLELVQQGAFRSDLYYRLAVVGIDLPPLRARKADIVAIAASLLKTINSDFEKQEPGYKHKYLCDSAKSFVKSHAWPGNVRELYNVLVQAAVMTTHEGLTKVDLSQCVRKGGNGPVGRHEPELAFSDGFSIDRVIEDIQKDYIRRALDESHGVKSRAARLLGIANYQTLDARMKKLGIEAAR